MPTGASTVISGRKILEQRGRALTAPTESGCPPGFVFLGGNCIPATAQFQPGKARAAIDKKTKGRKAAVGRG